jgi:hypothetical protein
MTNCGTMWNLHCMRPSGPMLDNCELNVIFCLW